MKIQRAGIDLIEVASPCHASWEDMKGDERVRFCGQCRLNVYNLSDMWREEAEAFMRRREGRMCVRFFRRQDGTVLTKDCPVGIRALRQRLVRSIAALAGLLVALIGGTLFGGVINRRLPGGIRPPSEAFANWIYPERLYPLMGDVGPPVMGGVCAPPPPKCGPVPAIPSDPAETPLLEPTAEQIKEIQQRLAK